MVPLEFGGDYLTEEKEKEYRWRIKEGEKALILKVLARSLEMDVMAFWDDNAKELKAYNSNLGHWEVRRKIREDLLQVNGTIHREIEETYALLQKLNRKGTGRPWIYSGSPLEEYTKDRVLALCGEIRGGA